MLPDSDKELLKPHLVSLMLSVEAKYEKQLSEAISIIADVDFPDRWQSLLPELVSKFGCGDLSIINGVLSTTYSIFKRYNFKFRSDDLFREIKGSLEIVQVPLLTLLQQCSALLDQHAANPAVLAQVLTALQYIVQIFYSLSSQDIPEFFEDNLKEFMAHFHKFLLYALTPAPCGHRAPLECAVPWCRYAHAAFTPSADDTLNPVQKLKVEVCEVINLYMEKYAVHACLRGATVRYTDARDRRYEEQFSALLPTFVECIWNLLMALGADMHNVTRRSRSGAAVARCPPHDTRARARGARRTNSRARRSASSPPSPGARSTRSSRARRARACARTRAELTHVRACARACRRRSRASARRS